MTRSRRQTVNRWGMVEQVVTAYSPGAQPGTEVEIAIAYASATHVGGREQNEDAILLVTLESKPGSARTVMAVADGMGGHERGEVASRIAIETIEQFLREQRGADLALVLKQAFREANRSIYEADREDAAETMGTTLVVAIIDGKYASIANVGDSRAYLVRANSLTQITRDHSLVAERVAEGTMTDEEAKVSPQRNVVTQSLGHNPSLGRGMPDIFEITLLPEDRLFLCSDGFNEVIADDEFVEIAKDADPEDAVNRLIGLANDRKTSDNVSITLAAVSPSKVMRQPTVTAVPEARPSRLVPLVAAAVLLVLLVLAALWFLVL